MGGSRQREEVGSLRLVLELNAEVAWDHQPLSGPMMMGDSSLSSLSQCFTAGQAVNVFIRSVLVIVWYSNKVPLQREQRYERIASFVR